MMMSTAITTATPYQIRLSWKFMDVPRLARDQHRAVVGALACFISAASEGDLDLIMSTGRAQTQPRSPPTAWLLARPPASPARAWSNVVDGAGIRRRPKELEKAAKGVSGAAREQLIQQVLEGDDEPEAPVERRFITNDTTVEKLGELLRDNSRGILIFRDELIGFLRGMEREGHEQDRAFYLEVWDGGGQFTYDRIGRGTIHIPSCVVAIVGAACPGPLQEWVSQRAATGCGDDGLLQRFQVAVWRDLSCARPRPARRAGPFRTASRAQERDSAPPGQPLPTGRRAWRALSRLPAASRRPRPRSCCGRPAEQALELYRRAALLGETSAMGKLGDAYNEGKVARRDLVESYACTVLRHIMIL
jgi:TPR repeat protein